VGIGFIVERMNLKEGGIVVKLVSLLKRLIYPSQNININILVYPYFYMLEFMRFRCKGCGYYIDCTQEEFEERGEYCEDCFENKTE